MVAAAYDCKTLIESIDEYERKYFRDGDGNWSTPSREEKAEYEIRSLANKVDQFKTILIADLRVVASFAVTKFGIFNVNDLVNCASKVLSSDAIAKLDADVMREMDAAGKCLAFNLPTACGFHCMRAVERVIKKYLRSFFSDQDVDKMKNWGQYLAQLEKKILEDERLKPSTEAIALLKQIKDIYRNPVIHSDRTLSIEEASTLFHATSAAINRIAYEIPGIVSAQKLHGFFGAASVLTGSANDKDEAA